MNPPCPNCDRPLEKLKPCRSHYVWECVWKWCQMIYREDEV